MTSSRYGGVRALSLALALGCVAACGTTVPLAAQSSDATPGLSGDAGLGAPAAAGNGPVQPGTASGPGAVGSNPFAPDPGSGSTAAAVGTAGPAAVAGSSGRGFDAHRIYVGFPTNNDVNQAAGALGLGALNFGDQGAIVDAVVADLNAHGGLLGRTVVAVKHDLKTADLEEDPSKSAEQTCQALTTDTRVVAIVNVVAAIDVPSFYTCLAKHDTPVLSAGFTVVDDPFLAGFAPYLYKLTAATFTRLAPVWIDHLTALKYFSGWNTVAGGPAAGPAVMGLLYPAVQPQQRIFADLHKRLVAMGLSVVPDVQYTTASLNGEGAAMSNAVLTFNSEHVTHVLSSDSDVLLFMQAADKQQYHPRYGLTSYHAPAAALQAIVPASQLVGALGVGWLPISDVDASHNPGPVGPGEISCRATMHRHAVDITAAGAATVAFAECDGVQLLAAAAGRIGGLGSQQLRAGMSEIGPRFSSALVWRSALSSSRMDLPGAVRDIGFDGSAFHYLSNRNQPL